MTKKFALLLTLCCSVGALTQTDAQTTSSDVQKADSDVQKTHTVPVYKITVVGRTVKAVNYWHRSGSTKIDFVGTSLLPQARGDAQVKSEQGAIHIDAEFKNLQAASKFGPECLTYVLWAITPEGRSANLGEVLLDGDNKSKLNVTSNVQAFGLIVTAEPYFAVTQPSDVVVMQNEIRNDTTGTIEEVDAKYELLKRGQYTASVNPPELQPVAMDPKTPIELYEARNAVRIAEWTGADRYASDTLDKAKLDLKNADDLRASKGNRKTIITLAREAAQTAEDARVISVKKQEREYQARQQREAADAKAQAEQAQAEAQQSAQDKAQAEAARGAALAQQQQAQAEAGQARQAAEQAQHQAQQAQQQAQQAEAEKTQMRTKLLQQLNSILQTRDTPRGLVVNMTDVLFDSGKYTLKPSAREKLAKVAGVLQAYPGLTVGVDGYTDNRGGETFNLTLSEKRAEAVRDYLVSQGVSPNSTTARGFGEANPVASNDTTLGRQLNRRVELVLSGEVIGAQVGGGTPGAKVKQ